MNQKYIFLDIDGVLSPEELKKRKKFDLETLWELKREYQKNKDLRIITYLSEIFCIHKVQLLKEILEQYDVKLVLHSSWNYFPGEDITLILLKFFEIDKFLAKKWSAAPLEHSTKEHNIKKYIKENDVKDYIIIDDEFICYDLIKRQVMPRTEKGLNRRHFYLINLFLSTNQK